INKSAASMPLSAFGTFFERPEFGFETCRRTVAANLHPDPHEFLAKFQIPEEERHQVLPLLYEYGHETFTNIFGAMELLNIPISRAREFVLKFWMNGESLTASKDCSLLLRNYFRAKAGDLTFVSYRDPYTKRTPGQNSDVCTFALYLEPEHMNQ